MHIYRYITKETKCWIFIRSASSPFQVSVFCELASVTCICEPPGCQLNEADNHSAKPGLAILLPRRSPCNCIFSPRSPCNCVFSADFRKKMGQGAPGWFSSWPSSQRTGPADRWTAGGAADQIAVQATSQLARKAARREPEPSRPAARRDFFFPREGCPFCKDFHYHLISYSHAYIYIYIYIIYTYMHT